MSKCNISIDLDAGERRIFSPGEAITGTVHVHANDDCECKALLVGCLWKTHGRGDNTQGQPDEQQVFSGAWTQGSDYSYPFELSAPNGPNTYHGHLLNLDWYARARVDVPWGIDPVDEEDFLLVTGPKSNPDTYVNNAFRKRSLATSSTGAGSKLGAVALGIPLFAMGIVFFMISSSGRSSANGTEVTVAVSVVVGIIALVMMFVVVKKWLLKRKLGDFEVSVPQEVVLVGSSVPVEVSLKSSAREHSTRSPRRWCARRRSRRARAPTAVRTPTGCCARTSRSSSWRGRTPTGWCWEVSSNFPTTLRRASTLPTTTSTGRSTSTSTSRIAPTGTPADAGRAPGATARRRANWGGVVDVGLGAGWLGGRRATVVGPTGNAAQRR